MSQTQDEIRRIQEVYAKRARDIDHEALYSLFNPGACFLHTQLMRHVLSVLPQYAISSFHGRIILEVGCGGGAVLKQLLAYGADVSRCYGIDLLEWQLHRAHLDNPYLPLACANGQALPYPDSSFDMVLQFTIFTSILDPQVKSMVAREMLRVLKPTGLILWYDFWLNPTNAQTSGIRPREIRALFPGCHFEFRRITLAPTHRPAFGQAGLGGLLVVRVATTIQHSLSGCYSTSICTHPQRQRIGI